MATLTNPVTWTTNEVMTASLLNAFPNAVVAWSTNIDKTNIGTTGLAASNLKPVNTTESTFGGSNVGYSFVGPLASVVPLTVSGVSGQSADIFDVTLTSGGTKVLGVTSGGSLTLPVSNGSVQNLFIGAKGSDQSGSSGLAFGSGANGSAYTLLAVSASTTVQTVVGSAMVINLDGSTNNFAFSRAGSIGISGTLSQASARERKKNITPWVGNALQDILSVKLHRYHFQEENDNDEQHTGFIADEAPTSLTRGGTSVEPYSVAVMAIAAIQDLHARLKAAGVPGI